MKPEKNIISQLFSFVWVSRIYGCLPFSLKEYREESTRVLIFPLGILYGSVLVTGPALYRIIINLFFKEGYSENAVFKSSAILSCVTSLISFFSYTRNIKTVQSVYEKNLEYSKEIKREDFFKKAFWVTNGEIFLSEFLCIGYYLSYFLSYPDFFFVAEMVMEHILRYVITLFRFQFANSLFLLHAIFNLANEELHEVFKSKRMLVESNLKKSDGKILDVSKIIGLYTKASDSCVVLNACFGPTLASASIVMMLQIVLCCYTLVTKNITISMFLFWFGSFVIEEWFVLFSCEKVIRETKRTGVLVHNLMAQTKDPRLKEQLQQFSLQLLHRKIKFTACGLFPLNYTLIYSIAGAVTTYLVILIQFEAATNRPDAANCASSKEVA